jgi:hypothetical protein
MANMDDIIREQRHRDAMGYTELHREIERMRTTLRDQFAMAALSIRVHDSSWQPESMAKDAYLLADAMLAARKEEK